MNYNHLSLDILDKNLNDLPYSHFFSAFGYSDSDYLYLRAFKDKDKGEDKGINKKVRMSMFNMEVPDLKNLNAHDRGIFFVVNGDGQKKEEVRHARAQFIDNDDLSFPEQIEKLNYFPLEPSIIIKTRRSLHVYWLLENGDIKAFRNIQERLIQYFESDKRIKEENRVMRIYGFEHRKYDPVLVTLIKFDSDIKYTQKQLDECLPALKKKASNKPKQRQDHDLIPHLYDLGDFILDLVDREELVYMAEEE